MCYSSKKEKHLVHLLKRLLVNLNHVFVFSLFFSAVALLDICVVAPGEGVGSSVSAIALLITRVVGGEGRGRVF
jgi:hypothetical protein